MPALNPQVQQNFTYPLLTLQRASLALKCSSFRLPLFKRMLSQRIAMSEIAGENGLKNNYTKRSLSELAADNALMWLIEVGLLRREVDGQGITDSFRLTPLGRQLVESLPQDTLPNPTIFDRLKNLFLRIFRLPF